MCIFVKYGTWNISDFCPDEVRALSAAGYGPLCARVLSARGCADPAAAADYLRCDQPLCSPFLMKDMKAAADRVRLAVARRELIAVFGDYDVDGITSTALLTEFLQSIGGRVVSYIPARLEEGYGLNEIAIHQLFRQQVNLIVTVDCGITANDEAELCRKLGMDLVITDHHECKERLPRAVAVVDPHRPDCGYPHTGLSGVGVAFQLASAICGDQAGMLERFADLLALGLVADVMPLHGEVRTMVVRGLEALSRPARPGVAALMQECGVLGEPVTTATVGYLLAPRINAAGRMGQVETALELFLTRDPLRAQALASTLCRLNRERQKVEAVIYQEAVAMLPADGKLSAIVLAGETWHQGVVGIVASRLSEEYHCPAFLICLDPDGKGKASSRSYGGFNLFAALTQLSDLLESYGGHELAAGFTILKENIPAFRARITALAESSFASGEADAALQVDCAVEPELLTLENVAGLSRMEPCGTGCPTPVLCLRDAVVTQLSEVGGGKHLRLSLNAGGRSLQAIFFSQTALQAGIGSGDSLDVAFTPQINDYRSQRTVQLNVVDLRLSGTLRSQTEQERSLYLRFRGTRRLTSEEAARLLPVRSEFVAVWRYLVSNSRGDLLRENFTCLGRKIARSAGRPMSLCRTRVCLDVFAEQGLIEIRRGSRYDTIRITSDGSKVDLNESPIIRRLRREKEGRA